ncbi:MAG: hypothetical protein QOI20_3137 [Acidimicrobiaceae bacterium]|nr:hypothetical protein [Acidimicrobiaceae bacterium]
MRRRLRRLGASTLVLGASLGTISTVGIEGAGAATGALCSGTTAIAAGQQAAFAQRSDHSAWGFGSNARGQLGAGPTVDRLSPVAVSDLANATGISMGYLHTLAVFPDGTVKATGYNAYGEIGNGTTTDSHAVVSTGITTASAASAGGYHSLALDRDGTVWAWGRNLEGQLGDGTTTNRSAPVHVSGLTGVTAVAAAWDHSLAIRSDGTVWTWGLNTDGELGNGTKVSSSVPVQVSGITNAVAVDGGTNYSIALLADGTVRTWGGNSTGQLGVPGNGGKTTPVAVSGLANVTHIAAGSFHNLVTTADGRVWSWGSNTSGQLGVGSATSDATSQATPPIPSSNRPLEVTGASGATNVAAGGTTSYALRGGGTLWAWGNNSDGQHGNGKTTPSSFPVQGGCTDSRVAPVPWSLVLVADPPVASPGGTVTLTAVANQDVGPTPYAIELFDQTGLLLGSCSTGTSCSATVTSATQASRAYTAYVASPSATAPPPFVQASAQTTATWGPGGPSQYSGSCTAATQTVADQDAGSGHLLVKVQQPSADETWVCFRVNDSSKSVGGRVSLVAPSITAPTVTVDDNAAACATAPGNTAPGPHPLQSGTVGDSSSPQVPYLVDTYSNGMQAWTCVTAGDVHKRVVVSVTSVPPAALANLDGT